MYFIDNVKDLIGKEIAYVNMSRFAEAFVLATKDKGLFVAQQLVDEDGLDIETTVFSKRRAEQHIFSGKYMVNDLVEKGILTTADIEAHELEKKRLKQEAIARSKAKEKENERLLYERLKNKFEAKTKE